MAMFARTAACGSASRTALLLVLLVSAYGEKADFLILSNPLALSILNKYEQSASAEEKALFASYTPLRIVNLNGTLGDGVSPALKAMIGRDIWYFQKNSDSTLVNEKNCLYRQVFKNCEIAGDTMTVARSGSVALYERYPNQGTRLALDADEMIIRIFSYGGLWYCEQPGKKPRYGWAKAGADAWRRLEHAAPADTVLPAMTQKAIAAVFQNANAAYEKYFDHFNAATGQQKSVPQWRCSAGQDGGMQCELLGARAYVEQLDESNTVLARTVEGLLLGTGFKAEYRDGAVAVRRKQ
jgi:hypothetical protein